ncbi:hypothetical protein CLOM_g24439, partial [Closterium sp. NIES-68]
LAYILASATSCAELPAAAHYALFPAVGGGGLRRGTHFPLFPASSPRDPPTAHSSSQPRGHAVPRYFPQLEHEQGGREAIEQGGREAIEQGGQEEIEQGGREEIEQGGREAIEQARREAIEQGGEVIEQGGRGKMSGKRVGNKRGQ